MLIVGITAPWGKKYYVAGAFPSACGKTNLAMLQPALPGWKIETVGDDICWMRIGEDGRLWAVNPEAGCFGVAPGTSMKSNPQCMRSLSKNAIFTNCAMTPEGDVWWEGMTDDTPPVLSSWLRTDRFPDSGFDAAHANSRFTVPSSQIPCLDPDWMAPKGVPISAIIFGGRRSNTVPLVYESRDWDHGVFIGATMNSETTAAAAGKRGVLRNDPFAMKPFCGYNMADYFGHWLSFKTRTAPSKLPKIFHVNWFRKSPNNKFLWPGFGDNIRALEWILRRSDGDNTAGSFVETPIGKIPTRTSVNTQGLDMTDDQWDELMRIDAGDWIQEVKRSREFLDTFGSKLPQDLNNQCDQLQKRLESKK
jgi:phosphoenolpyruvate carboxykinase (GTP)